MADWRDIASRRIHEALAGLPGDATLEQKRQAINGAYPFGQRRYWPYKVWLKEVRRALAPVKAKEMPERVQFILMPGEMALLCTWCTERFYVRRSESYIVQGGCLVCAPLRKEFADRGPGWDATFGSWVKQMLADPSDLRLQLMFADMIEEKGFGLMADQYRRYCGVLMGRHSKGETVEAADGPAAAVEVSARM